MSGTPVVIPTIKAPLNAQGKWIFGGPVPNDPSLPGLTITFTSFTLDACGQIVQTNLEAVAFL